MAWNPAKPPRISWNNQQTTRLLENISDDPDLRRAFYPRPGEPRLPTQRRYELSKALTDTVLAGTDYVRWLAYMTPSEDVPDYLRLGNTVVNLPIAGRLSRLKTQAAPVLIKIGHKYRSAAELPPNSESLRIWKEVQPQMPWLFTFAALLAGDDPRPLSAPAPVRSKARSVAPTAPTPGPSVSTTTSGSKRSRAASTSSASSSSSSTSSSSTSSSSTTTTTSSSSSDGIEILEKPPASIRKSTRRIVRSPSKSVSSSPIKRKAKRLRVVLSSSPSSSSESEASSAAASAPPAAQWSSGMFNIIELDRSPAGDSAVPPQISEDVAKAISIVSSELESEDSDSDASMSPRELMCREAITESDTSDDDSGSDSDTTTASCNPDEKRVAGESSESLKSDRDKQDRRLRVRLWSNCARRRSSSFVPKDVASKAYKTMVAEARIEAQSQSLSQLSKFCKQWGHAYGCGYFSERHFYETPYTEAKRRFGKMALGAVSGIPTLLREMRWLLTRLRKQARRGRPLNYSKEIPEDRTKRVASHSTSSRVDGSRPSRDGRNAEAHHRQSLHLASKTTRPQNYHERKRSTAHSACHLLSALRNH